jgi:hypothetical protein
MHYVEYGTVPLPFAHAHLGHIHLLDVPNGEMFPGFLDAYHNAHRRPPAVPGRIVKLEAAE